MLVRPYQHYDPREEFRRLCSLRGLTVTSIPLADHHETYRADDIEVSVHVNDENVFTRDLRTLEHWLQIWEVRLSTDDIAAQKVGVTMQGWGAVGTVAATLRSSKQSLNVDIRQDVSGAIGNYLWPSSVVTADYILRTLCGSSAPASPKNKALELGSGCGLVSMALAFAGFEVTATDKPAVLPLLRENLSDFERRLSTEADQMAVVRTAAFEWSEAQPEELQGAKFDTIVCCDCLYASTAVEPLLNALRNVRLRYNSRLSSHPAT